MVVERLGRRWGNGEVGRGDEKKGEKKGGDLFF